MLNKQSQIILVTLAVVAVFGCGAPGQMEGASRSEPPASQPTSPSIRPAGKQPETAKAQTAAYSRRDVVRQAELSIRVPDIEKSERAVGESIRNLGGFIEGSETSDLNASTPQISMKLKVPVDRFDAAIDALEGQGHRLMKKTSVEDVTGQLVDYEARLKIMLAQEASMRNMLKGSTNYERSVDIQTRIMNLRADIESLAGQRQALGSRAAMSTITLTLVSEARAIGATKDEAWFRESWNTSTSGFVAVAQGIGSVALFFLVFSPIWLPIGLLVRWLARRKPQAPPVRFIP
ncbi:MAG: DUF4349 domain-containing protein [Fimbriimonadaceae bacterium]